MMEGGMSEAAVTGPPPLPIELYVTELGSTDFPLEAVALCTVHYSESGPLLRRLIERAAAGA
jgi:hypothetical protein